MPGIYDLLSSESSTNNRTAMKATSHGLWHDEAMPADDSGPDAFDGCGTRLHFDPARLARRRAPLPFESKLDAEESCAVDHGGAVNHGRSSLVSLGEGALEQQRLERDEPVGVCCDRSVQEYRQLFELESLFE